MGNVYEAEHLVLGRPVALKVLKPTLAADEGVRERFLREPRLAAAIRHPNIVPILDAGEADGRPYIAMEYIKGTTLRAMLDERGRLEPEDAIAVLRDVAAALDAAHARGLVHRDVKPANVLIDESGQVILSDFGVAKDLASNQATTAGGSFFGTPDYAPPEQFEGGEVDARSDVYSLGCVTVECLTGAVPFEAHSGLQAFVAHVQEDPPLLTTRVPSLPVGVDVAVARALAKDPDERHQSCAALVEALERSLAGDAEEAGDLGRRRPVTRGWRGMGTRGRAALVAATLCAAVGAGVGGALVASGSSGDAPAEANAAPPATPAPANSDASGPSAPPAPDASPSPSSAPPDAQPTPPGPQPTPPAAEPAEPEPRIGPAPAGQQTPAPVDDSILAASPAGGITIGDEPERPFDEILFDFDIDQRGRERPAVVAFMDDSDGSVTIPFDDNYEIPGRRALVLLGRSALSARGLVFEETDDDALVTNGTLTDEDTGEEVSFALRIGLNGGSSTFVLDGNRAILNGDLGSATFRQVRHLIDNHPEVDTIVMANVPGSVDDTINVETGRLIREAGYATVVATAGEVASGGVDLFAAGTRRTIEAGGRIGVHSWCCAVNGRTASELPRDDPAHAPLVNYLTEMLGAENGTEFYFFTLEAAPFDSIHFMTPEEIARFGLETG